ncbi:MAG: ArsR/SmtB family transcription factor [Bacteroidia bacterium]
MGLMKTELREEQDLQLAKWAAVLANPARLAILRHLMEQTACINSDLVDHLGLAQPTVTQHLKELKNAGLIQGQILGQRRNYCLCIDGLQRMQRHFAQLFDQFPSESIPCDC